MAISKTVREYIAALERLKQGKPNVISKPYSINKRTVAIEAGRDGGSIRNRPGMEELIALINEASGIKSGQKTPSKKAQNDDAYINELQNRLNVAESRYMSLLMLNHKMARELRKHGLAVPKFGEVSNLVVNHDDSVDTFITKE